MSNSEEIILFDLPSRDPRTAWSLNPWKTRFVLNYKELPYETQWVEYPDIKPILESHIPPNQKGTAYTSPTIRLPDGTYHMDSRPIASILDSLYPSPPLHLDHPTLLTLESRMPLLMDTLVGIYIPLVPVRILNSASHPHWYKTREARFGMSLDQLAETKGGDAGYKAAEPHLRSITDLLNQDSTGPFFLGSEVSYADFVWGGFLLFMKMIGEDVFGNVLEKTGDEEAHLRLLEGLKPWSSRNDR